MRKMAGPAKGLQLHHEKNYINFKLYKQNLSSIHFRTYHNIIKVCITSVGIFGTNRTEVMLLSSYEANKCRYLKLRVSTYIVKLC